MGYSLGSVPSVHIASNKNIKCLILIAPLASGIKTIIKDFSISTNELEKIDIFCNLSKIIDITCPIMLIHGKSDEVINVNHSYEMLRKIKNPNIWFPTKGTHGNIFTDYRRKFLEKLNIFFDKVKIFHSEKKYEEQIDSNDLNFNKYEQKNMGIHKDNSMKNGVLRIFNSNFGSNRQESNLISIEEDNRNTFGYNEEVNHNEKKFTDGIFKNLKFLNYRKRFKK